MKNIIAWHVGKCTGEIIVIIVELRKHKNYDFVEYRGGSHMEEERYMYGMDDSIKNILG